MKHIKKISEGYGSSEYNMDDLFVIIDSEYITSNVFTDEKKAVEECHKLNDEFNTKYKVKHPFDVYHVKSLKDAIKFLIDQTNDYWASTTPDYCDGS